MIIKVKRATELNEKFQKEGKKIGLITGCFDILHIGHIKFFKEAKKKVDILIVGLENDKTIELSKGVGRPVNTLRDRAEQLEELKSVDYVFVIEDVYCFGSEDANEIHERIWKYLHPDFILSTFSKDLYLDIKEKRAKELEIGFIKIDIVKDTSSSEILKKLVDTE